MLETTIHDLNLMGFLKKFQNHKNPKYIYIKFENSVDFNNYFLVEKKHFKDQNNNIY